MEILTQTLTVTAADTQADGTLTLSRLLYWVQEISGQHSDRLGFSWQQLADRGLFWAVLRHGVQITRLPKEGEQIRLETWPMTTTRTAYPRAVQAFDEAGALLFSVVSLWVLMDRQQRTMVLPGKSGVTVPGIIRGCEAPSPGSLPPVQPAKTALWQVTEQDLDVNNHVNNTVYVDRALTEFPMPAAPKSMTVCYLAEVNINQEILLQADSQPGIFNLDGCRRKTNVSEGTERVFSLRLTW